MRSRLSDHKRRCTLDASGFGEKLLTPEANVQDRSGGGRIPNSPIETKNPTRARVEMYGCKDQREALAAIQRQANLRLAPRQVHGKFGKQRLPHDPDLLPREDNISGLRRNQLGGIRALWIIWRRS